jgi:hypothetical protein
MSELEEPVVCEFYKLFPDAPDPRRASTSADGMMLVEPYQYCEAMRSASGYGWYIYPPINFMLILEEDESITWTYEGADARYALTFQGAQLPGFSSYFDEIAPDSMKSLSPTFLTQAREPGIVQIWSGLVGSTLEGVSLLSRGPVNIPNPQPYRCLEGIVETDRWREPIFTNIKLLRTNSPVHFNKRYPLFQVLPVQRQSYQKPSFAVRSVADFDTSDWEHLEKTIKPNTDPARRQGHYAIETRKRQRSEEAE